MKLELVPGVDGDGLMPFIPYVEPTRSSKNGADGGVSERAGFYASLCCAKVMCRITDVRRPRCLVAWGPTS